MMERPILMIPPMVRATLRGSDPKEQTRRIMDPQPTLSSRGWSWLHYEWGVDKKHPIDALTGGSLRPCRYGQPGDRLWVKETFFAYGRWETRYSAKKGRDEWHFIDMTLESGKSYVYTTTESQLEPTGDKRHKGGITPMWWKRPSIFMPRQASRITLEITGVRVERLQEISADDALAEGINLHPDHHSKPRDSIYGPVQTYRDLWEQINGPRSWDVNPWVWVVEFRRITL